MSMFGPSMLLSTINSICCKLWFIEPVVPAIQWLNPTSSADVQGSTPQIEFIFLIKHAQLRRASTVGGNLTRVEEVIGCGPILAYKMQDAYRGGGGGWPSTVWPLTWVRPSGGAGEERKDNKWSEKMTHWRLPMIPSSNTFSTGTSHFWIISA